MCTLVVAWQVFDPPVVAGANRDERLDRESSPPAVRDWEPRVVAPLDEDAGGTWIGYNEHVVFAAITNRWTDRDLAGERSRGMLVRDVLRSTSAEAAARHVERSVDDVEYDGFNLLVADANAAIYLEWDGHLRVSTLSPGVHLVVNVGANGAYTVPAGRREAGAQQAESANRAREQLRPTPGEGADEWLGRLATLLGDHEYGLCVHGDGFGTRSSSLLVLGEGRRTYRYADGPPCRTPYRPVESQV